MTGVTQISSLSSSLSKAPEPGLTAQREIPKKKKTHNETGWECPAMWGKKM